MRILYNSRQLQHKTPFGTLTPGQACTLTIHIPSAVKTQKVLCVINQENGCHAMNVELLFLEHRGAYDIYQGTFSFDKEGLYYYYFYITNCGGGFRLFKQGDDTNMEAGDLWQVSCVPFPPPIGPRARSSIRYSPTVSIRAAVWI